MDEASFSMESNLSSARRVKSSQGSRRGTCGWITSFFLFYDMDERREGKHLFNYHKTTLSYSHGPVAQAGRAPPLHSCTGKAEASGSKRVLKKTRPVESPDGSIQTTDAERTAFESEAADKSCGA